MPSDENTPSNALTKPPQLIHLEQLSAEQLNAMTPVEVEERIEEAAYALADNYQHEMQGGYKECVETVSTILFSTGAAINTQVGHLMVAKCEAYAAGACRIYFPEIEL